MPKMVVQLNPGIESLRLTRRGGEMQEGEMSESCGSAMVTTFTWDLVSVAHIVAKCWQEVK